MSIDEIHFQLGPYRLYDRAPCDKKAISNCMPDRTDYSAIIAIDSMDSKPLSLFVKGTVNVLVFVDNFRMLLSRYKGKRYIFLMHNASIHNRDDLKYLCHEANQIILFNAPYTPDFNPIEMCFAEWKKVFKRASVLPSQEVFISILKDTYLDIDESIIHSLFIHVQTNTFP